MQNLKPKKGRILIAEPSILNDKSFNRSIVLLTEHGVSGSIGFIINKPLDYTLEDLVPEINCDFKVYDGGPVSQENLYFIHNAPDLIPESIQIENGIYWGGDFDTVSELLQKKEITPLQIRFFLGYAGWETDQLNDELKGKDSSWIVSENRYENILSTNSSIWKTKLLELGGKYKIWANAPKNPILN